MKVQDVMTSPVQSCTVDTNLAAAAGMMWDSDCGVLPVVDLAGRVIGMISDRDICMAVATKKRLASEIATWEVVTGKVVSCRPEDQIRNALKAMADNRLRRLPVVDNDGTLIGILAINDIVLLAEKGSQGNMHDLSYSDVVETLKAISKHRVLTAA